MHQDDNEIATEARKSVLQKLLGILKGEMVKGAGDKPMAPGLMDEAKNEFSEVASGEATDEDDEGAIESTAEQAAEATEEDPETDPMDDEIRSFMKGSSYSPSDGPKTKVIIGLGRKDLAAGKAPMAAGKGKGRAKAKAMAEGLADVMKAKKTGRRGRGIV